MTALPELDEMDGLAVCVMLMFRVDISLHSSEPPSTWFSEFIRPDLSRQPTMIHTDSLSNEISVFPWESPSHIEANRRGDKRVESTLRYVPFVNSRSL